MNNQSIQPSYNIIVYLEVLVRFKKLILSSTLITFTLMTIASFFFPKYYTSTARILTPQQDNGMMGLMLGQMGGGVASLASDILGSGSPADISAGLLKSDTIKDAIINKYNLIELYGQKYRLDTYKILDKRTSVEVGKKDGIISITVEDKDPKRAADIVNSYVDELGKLSASLNMTSAKSNSAYLEQRISKAKLDLLKAEDALRTFQTNNKAIDVSEQAKGVIKGIADLEAQLTSERVKLSGLSRIYTDASQEVKSQKIIITNLQKQVNKFEGDKNTGVMPGIATVPKLSQHYLQLLRTLKVQEAIVELLTKQYEMTKLSVDKDISSLQIIQKAKPSDKKSRPKRSLIIISSTSAAFLLSIITSFLVHYITQMNTHDKERLIFIFNAIIPYRKRSDNA